MANPLPRLVSPRAVETLEAVRSVTGGHFDIDAWHAIDERDNQLIADEILNGPQSAAFVYQFTIGRGENKTNVAGISVVGARHLAGHYQGLKHRLVASTQKVGSLFTFTSFPAERLPMSVTCAVVPELSDEPDYYSVIVDMTDIKTGNTIQIESSERRHEFRSDGTSYERSHYQKIAQSKAFRNGALHLIPQDVQAQFLALMLRQRKGVDITASVIGEKRAGVIRFATAQGLVVDRRAIEHLSADQISGLGDAAREGAPAFVNAARALGLGVGIEESAPLPGAEPPRKRGRPPKVVPSPQTEMPIHGAADEPAHDPDTGEIREPGEEG